MPWRPRRRPALPARRLRSAHGTCRGCDSVVWRALPLAGRACGLPGAGAAGSAAARACSAAALAASAACSASGARPASASSKPSSARLRAAAAACAVRTCGGARRPQGQRAFGRAARAQPARARGRCAAWCCQHLPSHKEVCGSAIRPKPLPCGCCCAVACACVRDAAAAQGRPAAGRRGPRVPRRALRGRERPRGRPLARARGGRACWFSRRRCSRCSASSAPRRPAASRASSAALVSYAVTIFCAPGAAPASPGRLSRAQERPRGQARAPAWAQARARAARERCGGGPHLVHLIVAPAPAAAVQELARRLQARAVLALLRAAPARGQL